MKTPKELRGPLTDGEQKSVDELIKYIEEELADGGDEWVEIDTINVNGDDDNPVPDRLWDAAIREVNGSGWEASRRGRVIRIRPAR